MKPKKKSLNFNIALVVLLLALFFVIGFNAPSLFKPKYMINVMLRNIVELGLMALPVTMIVITGGIDLSVGSMATLCAVAGGMTYTATESDVLAVLAVMLTGIVCGAFNGLIVTRLKIPAMVTTLATYYLFMGIARGITLGNSVYAFPAATWLGTYEPGGIPIQIPIYIVLAIIFTIILSRSYYGKYLYAIGINAEAARFSGIDTSRMKMIAYTLSGILCALAALIMLGRFSSIKYTGGEGMNLKVVTIIVLGGTSIVGGKGNMIGTILATLIIAVLNSGLTVLNIPIDVQNIVQGGVLLIALIAYALIELSNARVKTGRMPATAQTVK